MIHRIDKEAVKRIVYLRQVQGLSFSTIGERFEISSTRAVQIFKRQQKKQQTPNVKPEMRIQYQRFFGAPYRIRTSDPRFRKPMLYPTELRALS